MTYTPYRLQADDTDGRTPALGEDISKLLERAARKRMKAFNDPRKGLDFTHLIATAQLFALAADALEDAANCDPGGESAAINRVHVQRLRDKAARLEVRIDQLIDSYGF